MDGHITEINELDIDVDETEVHRQMNAKKKKVTERVRNYLSKCYDGVRESYWYV